MRKRKIIGIQLHHSVNLADAVRFAVNACSALEGAIKRTQGPLSRRKRLLLWILKDLKLRDPTLPELHEEALRVVRRISKAEREASARLIFFQSRPDFRQIVDGDLPWPDETEEGFEARCRCYDQCLACDHGAAGAVCTCGNVCYAHPPEEAA